MNNKESKDKFDKRSDALRANLLKRKQQAREQKETKEVKENK